MVFFLCFFNPQLIFIIEQQIAGVLQVQTICCSNILLKCLITLSVVWWLRNKQRLQCATKVIEEIATVNKNILLVVWALQTIFYDRSICQLKWVNSREKNMKHYLCHGPTVPSRRLLKTEYNSYGNISVVSEQISNWIALCVCKGQRLVLWWTTPYSAGDLWYHNQTLT